MFANRVGHVVEILVDHVVVVLLDHVVVVRLDHEFDLAEQYAVQVDHVENSAHHVEDHHADLGCVVVVVLVVPGRVVDLGCEVNLTKTNKR